MATIPFSSLKSLTPHLIDTAEACSEVSLVLAGEPAGKAADGVESTFPLGVVINTGQDAYRVQYIPAPITYRRENVDADFRRLLSVPFEGRSPFLPPDQVDFGTVNIGGTWAGAVDDIRDGDPTSYLQGDDGYLTFNLDGTGTVGFGITYELDEGEAMVALLYAGTERLSNAGFVECTFGKWKLPPTKNGPETFYAVLPHDARHLPINGGEGVVYTILMVAPWGWHPEQGLRNPGSYSNLLLYELLPLQLDTALLYNAAGRVLKEPASRPMSVTVAGFVPPAETHTLLGWPGGDYTGTVARQVYREGETTIDFEQVGGVDFRDVKATAEYVKKRITRDTYLMRLAGRT